MAGIPATRPQGPPVWTDGAGTQVAGAVSVDMITVDLIPYQQADIGNRVKLWGKKILINEDAYAAGTVGNELTCALAPRVPVGVIWFSAR
ncbi:MAG TPA: hypothetical protein DEO80_07730 [Leclercia adecarboxylata]|uniref:alanine racemase C-terminal domain-containing protein n=1 Tax=Leclercia adecarboxylata TaxID=83655 RepID=UPI000ED6AAF1|nr:hypothetical protein [Leclercia adecarboxylata]QIG31029.1 hypothetical protein FY044_03585 [Leclercia adecarboxylata]HBZ75010.1 hypothetical protein [Leclercia adecarboxylata]